jgi:hypothetical protein
VHGGLISIAHSGTSSQDRRDAHGGARGGSPKLSLALASEALSLQGLHLRVLWKMGVLTDALAVVNEVGSGRATRKRTQGKSAKSRGPCGESPASVLLLAVAVVVPLPQQPIGRARGTAKGCSGKRMGRELSERGKRLRGLAGEVQFIGAWPGTNTRGFQPALIAHRINDSTVYLSNSSFHFPRFNSFA